MLFETGPAAQARSSHWQGPSAHGPGATRSPLSTLFSGSPHPRAKRKTKAARVNAAKSAPPSS
eukprot:CAMPEP_0119509256 /NCGR_PEP_ID=MMETSP1344-20130328/28607_1 /TAXON_ID=236787 /ORGANISM="Florenciella parvula, Strain CCMP2471" /LENGTH=62 /DNA_ID=CAMNT_0007546075 /DNA_START=138 /DNA_END=323 /DNA_ORIENTATION=+